MRNCFLPPIPALEQAITLLDQAVDATLMDDQESACQLIKQADMPEIYEFMMQICGRTDPKIHRQHSLPKDTLPKSARIGKRMPTARVERAIFARDGYRCRFCGIRVISRKAIRTLVKLYPEVARWGRSNIEKHYALSALSISLDHVLPHSRGGTNEEANLVSACTLCQFGRNAWTLEEVEFNDPRERPPVVDDWDGLTRLLAKS